ncbi:hypothetical protein D3C76_900080 [compost metagenome]
MPGAFSRDDLAGYDALVFAAGSDIRHAPQGGDLGALLHGEPGKAYLVGDEDLSYAQYFQAFLRAAGNASEVPPLDQEHPLLPDMAPYKGASRSRPQ